MMVDGLMGYRKRGVVGDKHKAVFLEVAAVMKVQAGGAAQKLILLQIRELWDGEVQMVWKGTLTLAGLHLVVQLTGPHPLKQTGQGGCQSPPGETLLKVLRAKV